MLNEEEKAEDQETEVDEEESTEPAPEKQGKKAKKKWVTVLGNPTKCLL